MLTKIVNPSYSLKNVIAFGDSSNDLEMIRDAGYGIAVGNAEDHIKAIAKEVCLDSEENGAYHKLLELGIIN